MQLHLSNYSEITLIITLFYCLYGLDDRGSRVRFLAGPPSLLYKRYPGLSSWR